MTGFELRSLYQLRHNYCPNIVFATAFICSINLRVYLIKLPTMKWCKAWKLNCSKLVIKSLTKISVLQSWQIRLLPLLSTMLWHQAIAILTSHGVAFNVLWYYFKHQEYLTNYLFIWCTLVGLDKLGSYAYSMMYWKEKGDLRYDKQPIDDSIGGLIHLGRLQSQP